MLENEGYRNFEEYRKQAEKTNANKKSAITHALAVGAELAQMIETQTQKAEKAMASKNVAKAITASQNEESANRNGEKTAAASQEQTGNPSTFSEEQLKNMSVPQLKSILQSLAPAFAEKWKSAGLKAAEVDRQVAEMLGGNNSAQLARDIGTMQKELGTDAKTKTETNNDGLKGEEDGGRMEGSTDVGDTTRFSESTDSEASRVGRMNMAGKMHPVSGVKFDNNGFPVFEAKHEMNLNPSDYTKTRSTHFEKASKTLYNEIQNNPEIANRFTQNEIEVFKIGGVPKKYTWHHHQDPGVMQLVDRTLHKQTGHDGGYSIWGKK